MIEIKGMNRDATINSTTRPRKMIIAGSIIFIIPSAVSYTHLTLPTILLV